MTPAEAFDVIARDCLARLARDAHDEWGYYADVGEYDWAEIMRRMEALARDPHDNEVAAALAILESRVEKL